MGFFDKFNDVIDVLKKTADVGWHALPTTAVGGFALDLATAPWNDREDYNGFLNTIESRGMARVGDVLKPLDLAAGGKGGEILHEVGSASRQVFAYGVTRPVTTAMEAFDPDISPDTGGSGLNWKNWRDAWNASRDVSPGQAFTRSLLGGWGDAGGPLKTAANKISAPIAAPGFDITNPEDRTAFHHGAGRLISGAADFVISWNYDPAVLAGKGISGARAALVTKPISDVTKARPTFTGRDGTVYGGGEKILRHGTIKDEGDVEKALGSSKVSRFVDELTARTPEQRVEWLARNPTVAGPRASDDGAALMHLLSHPAPGKTLPPDGDEIRAVLRYAIDPNTRNRNVLELMNRPLRDQIDTIRDVRIPQLEAALARGQSTAPWTTWREGAIADANAKLKAMDAQSDYADFLQRAVASQRNVPRITVPQRIGDRVAAHNGGVTWAVYQPSKYNVPMRVLKSATTFRAGVIDVNRPADGYIQLGRLLDRAGHGFTTNATPSRLGGTSGGLSVETQGALKAAYVKAATETDKVAAITAAEKAVVHHYAARLGISPELAEEIVTTAHFRRREVKPYFKGESHYSGAPKDATYVRGQGPYLDQYGSHLDDEGVLGNHMPLLETDLPNVVPLLDVDQIAKIMNEYRASLIADEGTVISGLRAMRGAGDTAARAPRADVTSHPLPRKVSNAAEFMGAAGDEALSAFNRVWKPAQLARLGWTIRVVTDEQLRIIAAIGAMQHLPMVRESLARPSAQRAAGFQAARDEVAHLDSRVAAGETLSRADTQRLRALRKELKSRRADRAAKFTGDETVTDMHGRPVTVEGALGGEDGPVFADLASSSGGRQDAGAFGVLADVSGRGLNDLRAKAGQSTTLLPVPPLSAVGDIRTAHLKAYNDGWEKAANEQIALSDIGKRILEGRSDSEIVTWLRRSPEGKALRKRIPVRGHDPQRWVEEVRQHVDHYLPPQYPMLREQALAGRARIDHLEAAVPEPFARPEVHGESLDLSLGRGVVAERWDKIITGMYRRLGSTPTNVLSRHPHFASLYRIEMQNQVHAYELAEHEVIPASEIATMQRKARERALAGVRSTLYELSNQSNLSHAFRYISPFYSAWQEALTRWGSLFMEDPSRLARMAQMWEAPSKAGLVRTDPETGQQSIIVTVPKWLGGELLPDEVRSVGIPKYWMRDLVAQGTYWMTPGVGVPVAIPVAAIVRNRPDLYDNVKSLLPYGAGADSLDLLLPAAGRRLRSYYSKEDDAAYMQATVRIAQDLETDRRLGKNTMSDAALYKETIRRTNTFFAVRTVANLVLPFSPAFKSPYNTPNAPGTLGPNGKPAPIDGYIEAARRTRDAYMKFPGGKDPNGRGWEEKYLDEFGTEFFAFTASASKSNTGIAPTVGGYQGSRRFSDLITQAPEFGSLIVGADAMAGDFSSSVYNAQFDQSVGPGSTQKFRTRLSPVEVLESTQVDQGWGEYVQVSHLIDAALIDRAAKGLPGSLTAGANRDLAVIKKALVDKIAVKFPAWDDQRNTITVDKTAKFIRFWDDNINDPRFEGRPGFASFKTYLDVRKTIVSTLADRYAAGGGSSLAHAKNADLAAVWDAFTSKLIEGDVAFGTLFHRWLGHDLGLNPDPPKVATP